MEVRKGRTRAAKVMAVLAADMTSATAVAEATGIPRSTLRHWLDDPEMVVYRQKARAEMADAAQVVAWMAWEALAQNIREGKVDPRDLITAAGVAVDKMQLLSGKATERIETLTESLDDHERQALRDVIDGVLADAAAADAGADTVGAGAAVRE